MKVFLKIFFSFHLFIILTNAFELELRDIYKHFYNKKTTVPVLSYISQNVYQSEFCGNYMMLSGINTGYGFYGLTVSMQKFFVVTFYDSLKNEIGKDRYLSFSNVNSYSRLESLALKLGNYIYETQEMAVPNPTNLQRQEIEVRKTYVEKMFKWIGKQQAKKIPKCAFYKVTLFTILPVDIWNDKNDKEMKIYGIKEIAYANK